MTIQQSDIASRPGPKYIAITDALSDRIRSGDMKPGERLPTHRDLADTLGVTVATVTRAYKEAISRGLISGEVGRGSFVKEISREQDTLLESFPNIEHSIEASVDLGPILPAEGEQDALLAKTLKSMADRPDLMQSLLPYTSQPGLLEHHQQAGAQWLSRWVPDIDPDRVIATTGAQQALALAIMSSASAGEVILAETMAWFGTRALATSLNVGIEALPMDEEGIIPEALERACIQHNPRLLICSSNCQNPTTATMSLARREAIVDIARRYDLTLVEDGVFDFFADSSLPALTTLAPERTIYLSSFSKCISPAMRIGYMYIPENLFPRIAGYNRAMLICMPRLMLDIATAWIMDGTAVRLMEWQLSEFSARRKLARQVFHGVAEIRCTASWVWIDLPEPWTPSQYVARAGKEGLNVWASEQFMLGRSAAPPVVRISLGGFGSRDDVIRNLRKLADCMLETPNSVFG